MHSLSYKNKKAPIFRSRLLCFFLPLFMKRWFQPLGLHTRSFTNSFVCNFLSSSAGFNLCSCFFRLTLAFWLSLSGFSGPSIPRPCAASFPLSDLRGFRSLSVASLLDSDYSASALPFPLLPVSASQWLPQCSGSAFASPVFPVLPRLVSRAFLPGFGTQLCCSFPFALPCFAPTAVPQVFAFRFRFPHFPLPLSFLSSASLPIPATWPSVSSFPPLPGSASQLLSRCSGSALASPFFPFSPA